MKLLADSMLGSLGRWLRLLGYDTAIARHEPDAHLVRLARAEGRVILTRDRELAARHGVQTLLIASEELDKQLAQTAHDLPLPPAAPGSRCQHCNEQLQPASHGEAAAGVPPYVLETQESFSRCPACGRFYWRGTHWPEIEGKLAVIESSHRASS
jgi:uncharacterized protein with PIN domain